MNADDRGQAGQARPPFAPVTGEPPVRPQGATPPTGSVPQRTAFRSVNGAPSSAQGAQVPRPESPLPEGSLPENYAPTSYAPSTSQARATSGGPVAPVSQRGAAASGPAAAGTAPSAAYGANVLATAPVPTRSTTGIPTSSSVPTRSATGAFGVGRPPVAGADATQVSGIKSAVPGAPRKVRVLLSRIDPWSALKIGFLISIAAGIMTMVAAHILWSTLNTMGTFETIQEWVSKLFTAGQEVNILQFFSYKKDMSAVLLVSVVNVVLISGLSVIASFIYNMISRVVGGVYFTLTDD